MPDLERPLTGQQINVEQGMTTLKIKSSLSIYFASAAALFARKAHEIEQKDASPSSGQPWMDHRSYSIGAVMSSVTFLEASINELYLEAIDRNPNTFGAHMRLAELMGQDWKTFERQEILAKYETALTLAGKAPFPRGENPYQDTDALIHLRNALIHYKPEWDTELEVHQKLEERLSSRFAHNPFEQNNKSFFPHRCLGHGCAAWSFKTALEFYRSFRERLGIPPRNISDSAGLAVE